MNDINNPIRVAIGRNEFQENWIQIVEEKVDKLQRQLKELQTIIGVKEHE